ncbi:hypothetical protein EZS27_043616, partial [termite gut metagenome]
MEINEYIRVEPIEEKPECNGFRSLKFTHIP